MKKFFIVLFSLMFIFQPRPSFAGRKKYICTKLSSIGKDIGDTLKCAFNKNKCKEKILMILIIISTIILTNKNMVKIKPKDIL